MKKTMKKIASIGVAAAVAATSMTGVMAADLSELPAPFVKDGVENFEIVLGSNAAPADLIGAIDIAAAFQAGATSETTVDLPGTGTSASVEGGYAIADSSSKLTLNRNLSVVDARLDDSDLPDLLADGEIIFDSSNDEVDYEQYLYFGDVSVKFERDTDWNDPELFLDLEDDALWSYEVNFRQNLDFTELSDSETIEMLGNSFTVDPTITETGDIKLYGSDETTFLEYQTPVTVDVDGQSYDIEITGANANDATVFINVDGQRKSANEGDTVRIGGLDLYLRDVFVTELGSEASAEAVVFVGSKEIELPRATSGGNTREIEIDGEPINGLTAEVTGTNNTAVSKIVFSYSPEDLDEDILEFDEVEYLLAGDSISDPLFGTFTTEFIGENLALDSDSKSMFSLDSNGADMTFSFTNNNGDDYSFDVYAYDTADNFTLKFDKDSEGWAGVADNFTEDQVFAVNEQSGSEMTTYLFEVTSFAQDNGNVARIQELGGSRDDYRASDELVDSVNIVDVGSDWVTLNVNSTNVFYLQGGKNAIQLPVVTGAPTGTAYLNETTDADDTSETNVSFDIDVDDNDNDLIVSIGSSEGAVSDKDNDFDYLVTNFGSYLIGEKDDKEYVQGYVPQDEDTELEFNLLLVPTGANVVQTGSSGSSITTSTVNAFGVGIAKLDTDVSLATSTKNMIVVGGPCANSIAAELMNNPENCLEGFVPGEAMIKLFDNEDQDTVAMLVAGYDAIATQAASRAVAEMEDLDGDEVVLTSITSASNYQILQ